MGVERQQPLVHVRLSTLLCSPCSLPALWSRTSTGQTGTYGRARAGGFSHARASFNKAVSVLLPILLPVRLGTGAGGGAQRTPDNRASGSIPHTHGGRRMSFVSSRCLPPFRGQSLPSSPAPLFRRCLPGVRQAGERRARQGAGDVLRRVHINGFLQPVAGCLT